MARPDYSALEVLALRQQVAVLMTYRELIGKKLGDDGRQVNIMKQASTFDPVRRVVLAAAVVIS